MVAPVTLGGCSETGALFGDYCLEGPATVSASWPAANGCDGSGDAGVSHGSTTYTHSGEPYP